MGRVISEEDYTQELLRQGNKPKGDARFHRVLAEVGRLHDSKQADYGSEESTYTKHDPFANVRGSSEWGVPPWVGAMIRANDKVRRLQKLARTGALTNESARDSFLDLATYALIGLVLWEEEYGTPADGS